ncbi:MAG: sensor histidine kinase [Anaerolineae bacterium]|nr:sensor histidine kinase [Anaerolineae bacterium]
MERLKITGGILPLFRSFIVIRLIMGLFTLLSTFTRENEFLFEIPALIGLGECLFLLLYLSSSWLERHLGKIYLPLALIIASVGPWAENLMVLLIFPDFVQQFRALSETNRTVIYALLFIATQIQLAFTLFIPLILISWQYKLKWVFIYSIMVAVLNIIQVWLPMNILSRSISGMFGAAFALMGLFMFTGYVVNRLAFEQKERNRQLSHYADTLDHLATSRERNRLAREIHDILAHTLSGLAVNLEAVNALWQNNPDQAREILNQSLSVTREGLVETRRAIQALRAGPLDDLGLTLALKQLALSFAERYALQVSLDLPDKSLDLDPSIEQAIYRIAEEALRNICQHARATHFSMKLQVAKDRLKFSLLDDGRGMDDPSREFEDRFGMKGMQERAEAVGGILKIKSRQGHGTSLELIIEGLQK